MNRLNLDFSLSSDEARAEYVQTYIQDFDAEKPLTNSELEKIADYLLWGKNSEGLSSDKSANIELKSTWSSRPIISLDELRESPAFNEDSIHPISETPTKTSKQKFSRQLARKNAPPHILALLEPLWREIDEIDFQLSTYEVRTGKKEKVREDLLAQFTPSELQNLEEKSKLLNPYSYLKQKRLLIEKRREQFTLQDFYQTKLQRFIPHTYNPLETPTFDADIPIYPLGLKGTSSLARILFPEGRLPIPSDLKTEKDQRALSAQIWAPRSSRYFDFEDLTHLQALVKVWDSLEEGIESLPLESTLRALFETFEWYKSLADLTPLEEDVFQLKMAHQQNQPIVEYINKKYNKTYNSNYVSTIFHQKALLKICATATAHREHAENLFFSENFKCCKDCGRTLLLDTKYFMRRQSSRDGYSCRCKKCDRLLRYKREGREAPLV